MEIIDVLEANNYLYWYVDEYTFLQVDLIQIET